MGGPWEAGERGAGGVRCRPVQAKEQAMRLWRKRSDSARRGAGAAGRMGAGAPEAMLPEAMIEALEPRQMLYLGPMIVNPTPVAAMENPGDTVFRIVTNLGSFDIETFDSTAPNTVNNFRQ